MDEPWITEPDDLMVCLDLMDERWPGYQNAKKIIRDHCEAMRKRLAIYENWHKPVKGE